MRLFCFEDHSPKVEPPRDIHKELLEARADLARLKKLPISAFTQTSHKNYRFGPYGPVTYSVDNKDDSIARKEAEIAELKVLLRKPKGLGYVKR